MQPRSAEHNLVTTHERRQAMMTSAMSARREPMGDDARIYLPIGALISRRCWVAGICRQSCMARQAALRLAYAPLPACILSSTAEHKLGDTMTARDASRRASLPAVRPRRYYFRRRRRQPMALRCFYFDILALPALPSTGFFIGCCWSPYYRSPSPWRAARVRRHCCRISIANANAACHINTTMPYD